MDGTGVLAVGDPPAQVRHAKFLLASICKFFYVVNETTAQPLSPRDDGFSFYPNVQITGRGDFFRVGRVYGREQRKSVPNA